MKRTFDEDLRAACVAACEADLQQLDALPPAGVAPVHPARRRPVRRVLRVAAFAAAFAAVAVTGAAAVWPQLQAIRQDGRLLIGPVDASDESAAILQRMEFGYLPDGWTVEWGAEGSPETNYCATLSDAGGERLYLVQMPPDEPVSYFALDAGGLSAGDLETWQQLKQSGDEAAMQEFLTQHSGDVLERLESDNKTLESIDDLTVDALVHAGTVAWPGDGCWYLAVLLGDMDSVDAGELLRVLQGVTP